jgi:hypothetical protein
MPSGRLSCATGRAAMMLLRGDAWRCGVDARRFRRGHGGLRVRAAVRTTPQAMVDRGAKAVIGWDGLVSGRIMTKRPLSCYDCWSARGLALGQAVQRTMADVGSTAHGMRLTWARNRRRRDAALTLVGGNRPCTPSFTLQQPRSPATYSRPAPAPSGRSYRYNGGGGEIGAPSLWRAGAADNR